MCRTAYMRRGRASDQASARLLGRAATAVERVASIAIARRWDSAEWASSTNAMGSLVLTPAEKIAQIIVNATAGTQLIRAKSHGRDHRYWSSRVQAPRTPAMNVSLATLDQNGHARSQSFDFFKRTRAYLEGLDVIPARLTCGTPCRVFTFWTHVVHGQFDRPTAERRHFSGDLRTDLHRCQFVLTQVEHAP